MWIASARWRPADGETKRFGRAWGSRKPVDLTEDATPATLSSFFAQAASDEEDGDFILEVADVGTEDFDALTELLEPGFEDHVAENIAEFLTMDHPVSSFTQFTVRDGGRIDDNATLHFRAIRWVALVGGAELGSETLAIRSLRIVGRKSAVVVGWRAAAGYPRYPSDPDEIDDRPAPRMPGRMGPDMATQARLRGDPERLVNFEHGTGSEGPRTVPQMLSEWEDSGGPAAEFAETLLSRCVFAIREVATDRLPRAFDRWESALLERFPENQRGKRAELDALADLGRMVDFVDYLARTVGSPTADEPERYFAPTPSSEEILPAAEDAISALGRLRERMRTGLALLSAVSTSQTLELAQESQRSSERLQRTLSVLGAAILGPTLVVGLFGANTDIPGENTWWGFGLMVACMILSVTALLGVLRWRGLLAKSGETPNAAIDRISTKSESPTDR
jgi:CorA-like Mg2+ transporter protein